MTKIFDWLKTIFKNKYVLGGLIIVIIGGGYYGYTWYKKNKSTTTQYLTTALAKGTITSTVSGTGQIAASDSVTVQAETSGRVTSVKVTSGQAVKKGDTLATLNQTTASVNLAKAKAALEEAKSSYEELLEGVTEDNQTLYDLQLKSAQQTLDNAEANYTQTEKDQAAAVAKAYATMLNDGLELTANNTLSTKTITLSGYYTSTTTGSYKISLYQAADGLHYTVSGLGSASGGINSGVAQSIGNGLYITFGSSGTLDPSTTWTIDVPNTRSSSYQNNRTSYYSALDTQTEKLKSAQQTIDSAKDSLLQTQIEIKQKTETATQSEIDSAKASVASAEADLADAQAAYESTVVKSPFDGTISEVSVSVGDQASSGTSIATVITTDRIAKITLNELDAAKVKAGQKVSLTFSALTDVTATGTVAEVDSVGTVSQNVVSFTVKIALDEQNDQIKPGMSVTAAITTSSSENVFVVPSTAVKKGTSGSYILVLVDGKTTQKAVTTGLTSSTETEISGDTLQEGDEVVTQTITSTTSSSSSSSSSSSKSSSSSNLLNSISTSGSGSGGPPSGGGGPGQ